MNSIRPRNRQFNLNLTVGRRLLVLLLGSMGFGVRADAPVDSLPDEAQTVQQVIAAAESQFALAERLGNVWLTTREQLAAARSAAQAGQTGAARQLANKVIAESKAAVNQVSLEQARYLLSKLERDGTDSAVAAGIRSMLVAADGDAALRLAKAALKQQRAH